MKPEHVTKSVRRKHRLQSQRAAMKRLRTKRLTAGSCPNCGRPRDTVAKACSKCLKTDREEKRVRLGLKTRVPWGRGGAA